MARIQGSIFNILLFVLLVTVCRTDGQTGYKQRCVCLKDSANGYYCADQSCESQYKYTKCFSGRSTVHTREGKDIPLSKIQIGEEVLVKDGNELLFQPIYHIIHSEHTHFYPFIRLTLFNHLHNSTHAIELSSKHLIFKYATADPVFASDINIGDDLQLVDRHEIVAGKVIEIAEVVSQGFSAPLTACGTIVVNNVVSSNYAEARNHRLAHLIMQPYRWWISVVGGKQSVGADLDWYTSILYKIVDKTGVLYML